MCKALLILASLISISITVCAQNTYYAYNDKSTPLSLLKDHNGTPLSNSGAGFRLEVGYFNAQTIDSGTQEAIFSTALNGNFVTMFSFFSNGQDLFAENGSDDGLFYAEFTPQNVPSTSIDVNGSIINVGSYPTNTAFLALRWYDSDGYYNTVTASNWRWVTPTSTSFPPAGLDLVVPFEDTINYQIKTESGAIPTSAGLVASIVPEPGLGGFALAGLGALVLVRRRRKLGAAA